MPIISSQIISRSPQKLGDLITESHTDSNGKEYTFEYLAITGVDPVSILNARVPVINNSLKDLEYASILGDSLSYELKVEHSPVEFATKLRQEYAGSNAERTAKIATFVMNKIDSGVFNEATAIALLGIDQVTWDSYKAKMNVLRAAYTTINTALGK